MRKVHDSWYEMMRLYDDDPGDPGEVTVTLIDAMREYIRMLQSWADGSLDGSAPLATDNPIWKEIKEFQRILAELEKTEVSTTLHGLITYRGKSNG